MRSMKKSFAIQHCGGTISATARSLGITPSAVSQWPSDDKGELSEASEHRVLSYLAKRHLPKAILAELKSADSGKVAA